MHTSNACTVLHRATRRPTAVSTRAGCIALQNSYALAPLFPQVDIADRRNKKPLCRRWIVVEGVYANWGDLAPLDQLYGIKEKYKYRLMVEESFGFGALGATGRGACEHFGLQPHQASFLFPLFIPAPASPGKLVFLFFSTHQLHQASATHTYCLGGCL